MLMRMTEMRRRHTFGCLLRYNAARRVTI